MAEYFILPTAPIKPWCVNMTVIRLVENNMFPLWPLHTSYNGLIINEYITIHNGFIFGNDNTVRKIKAQMLFNPFVFLSHAIAVLVQWRSANAHVMPKLQQPLHRLQCASMGGKSLKNPGAV